MNYAINVSFLMGYIFVMTFICSSELQLWRLVNGEFTQSEERPYRI